MSVRVDVSVSFTDVFVLLRVIFALGLSMAFLDMPVEWLSMGFEWTWMLLFEDAQQGALYSVLFCFWIIFCGEHLMVSRSFFAVAHFSAPSCQLLLILSFIKSPGPTSEESPLSLLVASWACGVWIFCSSHI